MPQAWERRFCTADWLIVQVGLWCQKYHRNDPSTAILKGDYLPKCGPAPAHERHLHLLGLICTAKEAPLRQLRAPKYPVWPPLSILPLSPPISTGLNDVGEINQNPILPIARECYWRVTEAGAPEEIQHRLHDIWVVPTILDKLVDDSEIIVCVLQAAYGLIYLDSSRPHLPRHTAPQRFAGELRPVVALSQTQDFRVLQSPSLIFPADFAGKGEQICLACFVGRRARVD